MFKYVAMLTDPCANTLMTIVHEQLCVRSWQLSFLSDDFEPNKAVTLLLVL
jgi:hypothetical protein